MPSINEFLKNEQPNQPDAVFEKVDGIKPCSKCKIDVDSWLWDSKNLIMKWTCSNGHETVYKVG